jgi:hypothetical protein
VAIPTCSIDTCIMESISVASITAICVLELPYSMTYNRYLLQCSFHSDSSGENHADWAQQLREELFLLLGLTRSTNRGGICWEGSELDVRGMALDQVSCV